MHTFARVLMLGLLSDAAATSLWLTKADATPQPTRAEAVPEDEKVDLSLLKLDNAQGKANEESLAQAVAYRIGENADNDDFLGAFHH
eukprot:Skav234164  [mRNA]  locus=scaffold572:155632:155892:+ [translate_table: standard]